MPILFLSRRAGDASAALQAAGIAARTEVCADALEGVRRLEEGAWELVLIDADLVGGAVLDLVEPLAVAGQAVVVMTDRPSLPLTLRVLRSGGRDVLAFPPSSERLRQLAEDTAGASPVVATGDGGEWSWFGESPALLDTFRSVVRLAATDAPLLFWGEPGTGKESLARVVHEISRREQGPFVSVNCGALPEGVLSSELFGHERGALPGVYGRRTGRFVKAAQGTLFLDEISELSARMQHAVLRAMRDGAVTPFGGDSEIAVDVRVIAAMNRAPAAAAEGLAVPDLFHEFGGSVIHLPPLRERGEVDIRLLTERFLAEFAARYRRPIRGLAADAWDVLLRHPWPGNVRQLRGAIERAVLEADGGIISAVHLPRDVRRTGERMPADGSLLLDDLERRHILRVMELTDGHLGKAADLLGIHRNTLRRKLQGYGIEVE